MAVEIVSRPAAVPRLDFPVDPKTGTIIPAAESDKPKIKIISRPAQEPPPKKVEIISRPDETQGGFFERVGKHYKKETSEGASDFKAGSAANVEALKAGKGNPLVNPGMGQMLGGAARWAGSPVTAVADAVLHDPVYNVSRDAGASDGVAEFAGNTASLAGQVFGGKPISKAVEAIPAAVDAATSSRLGQAAKDLKDALSPTSAGPKAEAYAGKAREAIGTEERDAAQAIAAQEQFKPWVEKATPEQLREVNAYIQGRSKGVARPTDPTAAALADSLRGVMKNYEVKLKALPQAARMGFQEDYLNQVWEKGADGKPVRTGQAPAEPQPGTGGKQGSTGFTKAKTYQTIEEGIAAGLKPVTLDPIKLTAIYANNAKKYISAARMLEAAKDTGEFGFYAAGKQPQSWVPLEGRWTDKPARTIVQTAPDAEATTTHLPGKQAYAPPEIARIYNNYIAKGWSGNSIYEATRATSRAAVAMTLGVDIYHGTAETAHALAQTMSDAYRSLFRGELKQAAKTIGSGVTDIGKTLFNRGSGKKMRDLYLSDMDKDVLTPQDRRVVDLLTKANFGFSRGEQYSTYIRPELEKSLGEIWKNVPPGVDNDVKAAWETAQKAMSFANKPLFEHYIPNLRAAAAKRGLANYVERNPNATEEELLGEARKISDTIDNRFGLMVHDNRFWNKYASQVSQILLLAPEWTVGKLNMGASGAKELAQAGKNLATTGKTGELGNSAAQLLGLVTSTAFLNGVLSYIMTGEPPSEPMDFAAFKTGGTTKTGAPERGVVPGEQKDILGYLDDPKKELQNKVNPFLTKVIETWSNKDWRDNPIADPNADPMTQAGQYARNFAGAFAPGQITAQNVMSKGDNPGTHLSYWQRLAGFRQAPMRYTDPKRAQSMEDYVGKKQMLKKERDERKNPGLYDRVKQMFE